MPAPLQRDLPSARWKDYFPHRRPENQKNPRNLLANAVKRAGCLLFQQTEVVHVERLWQREVLAFQAYTINSPFSALQGAKWEYSFSPLHPRQSSPDSCSEPPLHTPVTSWQLPHALCDPVRKGTVCLQFRLTHIQKHRLLPWVEPLYRWR